MSPGHCIVEYISPKHPIKIKLTINSIISFLKAGKCVGETISSPEHSYVNVWDRGNLSKMNEDVIAIFSVAQGITNKLQNKFMPSYIQCTYGELYGAKKF